MEWIAKLRFQPLWICQRRLLFRESVDELLVWVFDHTLLDMAGMEMTLFSDIQSPRHMHLS